MTTSVLSLNSSSSNWYKAWHYIAIVPFRAIQKWFALFLITTGTLYASAEFNMQHGVFPPIVAYTLAVGIEWTYLSGLAYATELKNTNRKSTWMIIMGAFTSGMFGVMYILGHYNVIPMNPRDWVAWTLAFLHVLPLIILLFLYTLCKRDYLNEQHEVVSRQRTREDKWRDEKLLIEIEKDKLSLEKEQIRLEAMRARVLRDSSDTHVTPVSQTVTPHSNAELRAIVVDRYVSLGNSINVTRESTDLGISRAKWYKLKNEAISRGELQ